MPALGPASVIGFGMTFQMYIKVAGIARSLHVIGVFETATLGWSLKALSSIYVIIYARK
jgi:hypothetical protein